MIQYKESVPEAENSQSVTSGKSVKSGNPNKLNITTSRMKSVMPKMSAGSWPLWKKQDGMFWYYFLVGTCFSPCRPNTVADIRWPIFNNTWAYKELFAAIRPWWANRCRSVSSENPLKLNMWICVVTLQCLIVPVDWNPVEPNGIWNPNKSKK